jgi:peptidyl-prolyl cis-trans isomerase D
MMKQMRENTKVILWIVVAAFLVTIFAVWGLDMETGGISTPQNQGVIGKVNGVPVTSQAFQSAYSQLAQQYRSSGNLTATQQSLLQDQAWNSIVSQILTDQEIQKMGITATDEEVLAYLRSSPPPEVQQYFIDDNGNFDYAAYQAALSDPSNDWTGVEALARQRIPVFKLNQYLMAQVHVAENEVHHRWEEDNVRMLAQYVSFPSAGEDVGNYAPGEEEILGFYNDNSEMFTDPEKSAIDYVRVPIAATGTDREDISFTAGMILEDIEGGESFEDVAKIFSEAFTSQVGGDTGFITRTQRPEAVMDAAAALEPGAVSQPIETPEGLYLVQLVEKDELDGTERFRLREIFLKLTAGSQTIDSLITFAQEVQRRAAKAGLEAAASENGVTMETTDPFPQGFPIPGVGFSPPVTRFAFSGEAGAVSKVLSDDTSYFVCSIRERVPEGLKPLEDVRDTIVARLLSERRLDVARRKADAFALKMRTPDVDFADAAAQYARTIAVTDTFTVSAPTGDGIPPRSAFQYAALGVEAGSFTPPVETNGVWYVLRVNWRSEFDLDAFRGEAAAIHDRLYSQKVQAYVSWWYDELVAKSEIEDYRGAL